MFQNIYFVQYCIDTDADVILENGFEDFHQTRFLEILFSDFEVMTQKILPILHVHLTQIFPEVDKRTFAEKP